MNIQQLRHHLAATGIFLMAGGGLLRADNLIANGSFENEVPFDSVTAMRQYQNAFSEKNFEFDFDQSRWADGWVINGDMDAAKVSFGEREDGGRFLRIDSRGKSHLYTAETLPMGQYKASFMAKGGDNGAVPQVTPLLYYYDNAGWIALKRLQSFPLSDQWESFAYDIPADAAPENAARLRIAYEFSGLCDFDDVVVEDAP